MMTFNLRRHMRDDGPNAWPLRRDTVADVILDHAPDLVGTQEGTLPQLRDLDERLPGYLRVGGAVERWRGEEPKAMYYDPERVAVLDAGVFWLSRRPLQVGGRSWGAWGRRSALWALVAFRETGAPLLVVNTHLDHFSVLARRMSALLLQRAAPTAVIMGDFNARPHGFVHGILLDGRVDPLEGARWTHNAFTHRDRGRIDWVLLPEGVRVRKAAVIDRYRSNGLAVSDHRPVVVDVEPPRVASPVPLPRRAWDRHREVPTKLPPSPEQVESLAQAPTPHKLRALTGEPTHPH